jgi:hypothetical protein
MLAMPALLALSARVARATPEGDAMSVRELMRLETQLALRQARQRTRAAEGKGGRAVEAGVPGPDLELLAIYGVGSRLLAQVRHGGLTLVYMRGSALPVGFKGTPEQPVFRLTGLSGTCVELTRESVSRTLCLNRALPAGR